MTEKMNRRDFMRQVGFAGLGWLTPYILQPARPWTRWLTNTQPPETVFGISVASGDPTATGVILWTRVNPEVWDSAEFLIFEVALDDAFTQIVAQGSISGNDFGPEHDYTVKIDLDGVLSAETRYYYRFIYQGVSSRTGRCRTLPLPTSNPTSLSFGLLTCQDFRNGYYGAFAHLAQEPVDFVIHLGDFIYETGGGSGYPGRSLSLPSGSNIVQNVDDYRYLYRAYRSDAFFQQAMEQHTFIIIWDDHEFANNSYWDYELDAPMAAGHPFFPDPAAMTQLKLDSMRAWSEYVPARLTINAETTHPHDYYRLYRSFRFGDLTTLFMTDERTYRMKQPPIQDPDPIYRTMLGDAERMGADNQLNWLLDGLESAENAGVIWKVWGNEVLFMPLVLPLPDQQAEAALPLNTDAWDGYNDERKLIAQTAQPRRQPPAGLKNLVLITGDMHMYLAGYVKVDYTQRNFTPPFNNMIGVEFMTSAVTSANISDVLPGFPGDGERLVTTLNPHIRFFNGVDHGYCVLSLTRQECVYTAYAIPKDENSGDVPKTLLKRLRVPVNRVRLIDITP